MAGTPRERGGWESKGEAGWPISPCLELARDLEQLDLGSSVKVLVGRKWLTISRDLDPLSSEVLVEGSLENSLE